MIDLGGVGIGGTASARFDSGIDVVAYVGQDGWVWRRRWADGGWGSERRVSLTEVRGDPSMIVVGSASAHMRYARKSDGHIIQITTTDSGDTWK